MTKFDIWDIRANPGKAAESDELLRRGQKVRVTRMVTYVYEADISEILDMWDEEDGEPRNRITVKEFVEDERDNNLDYVEMGTEEDDTIISVEII